MKEILLQYCWKHRIGISPTLTTTDGKSVRILDPGLMNTDAGPDFINARIRIGEMLWAGNIEIHCRRQDWYAHGHDHDPAYDNVILHVVGSDEEGEAVRTSQGDRVEEVVIHVPQHVEESYEALMTADKYPPCYDTVPRMPRLSLRAWIDALQTERLQQKTEAIAGRVSRLGGDWEHAYFMTLARSFGFGSNSEALEQWAQSVPMKAVGHHRDDIFQVETMFYGMAGMLNVATLPARMQIETAADEYWQRMEREWAYLNHKFSIDTRHCHQAWRYMRMRPQNFPHIRIAQLAMMYHEGRTQLSRLIECDTAEKMAELLRCGVSGYWQDHYTFGHESRHSTKRLSQQSATLLMINCAIPMLFAYGRATNNDMLSDRALLILDSLHAEDNNITRMWRDVGLEVTSAGDSQALIQLKKEYCDRRRCTLCRIGDCHLSSEERGEGQGEYPKR